MAPPERHSPFCKVIEARSTAEGPLATFDPGSECAFKWGMPITPPIFVRADELLVFDSVAQAESWLEPVDVQPDERGYDAEGRALLVRVVGGVKKRWIWIDQGGARVEIVLAEETPAHAEELRSELASWLSQVEGAPVTGSLPELVERGRKYVYR